MRNTVKLLGKTRRNKIEENAADIIKQMDNNSIKAKVFTDLNMAMLYLENIND